MFASSANIRNESFADELGKSFIYKRNNNWPKVDPWATPHMVFKGLDSALPISHIVFCWTDNF